MQYVDAHGAHIPQIGIGTMTLTGDAGTAAIKTALEVGYRHLDTAAHYGNEKENGEALRASGVSRADVFITTKVRPTDAMPDAFARVVDQSLANLQLPFVELLLIHWPSKEVPLALTVGALCKAKRDGKTKHIGVSNFTTALLDEAWKVTTEPLVCNQIECHPFINQDKVIAACQARGMAVVAYVPIARGKIPGDEALSRIGKAHGKSAARLAPRVLERSVKECLLYLRLYVIDLLLIHWPNPRVPLAETLGAMAKVKQDGYARQIGVSNFTVALLDEANKVTSEPLVCNQIECHPFLDQDKVIAA